MGKKSTSQTQQTQQTDSRLVVDNGSIGNSGAGGAAAGQAAVVGSNNSVVVTDHGLIDSAFKYLMAKDIASGAQVDKIVSASSELSKMSLEKASASEATKPAIFAALGGLAIVALAGAR